VNLNIELAALDIAGTTVDEAGLVYRVLDETVAEAVDASVPPALLSQWKGTSKREAVAGLLDALGADTSEAAVDKVHADFSSRLITAYGETPPTPFPGVVEALETMRGRGVRIALQTGYSADIAAAIMAGLGWEAPGPLIDAIVTSDMVAASRPAPYLLFRCMEATGVTSTQRVLAAGDTRNDLAAGANAGARFVVGVLTGTSDATTLGRERHTHLLPGVAQLPEIL
jgi:phosphonatase-like hydrolase